MRRKLQELLLGQLLQQQQPREHPKDQTVREEPPGSSPASFQLSPWGKPSLGPGLFCSLPPWCREGTGKLFLKRNSCLTQEMLEGDRVLPWVWVSFSLLWWNAWARQIDEGKILILLVVQGQNALFVHLCSDSQGGSEHHTAKDSLCVCVSLTMWSLTEPPRFNHGDSK